MVALGFGVMGAVFGMAQVWYVGILGRLIGDPSYGGDIGFELAAAFTAMYVFFSSPFSLVPPRSEISR